MAKTRIMIVDDHTVLREGLKSVLQSEPEYLVVGEAKTGEEAIEVAKSLKPDLIVMDIALPGVNGIEATKTIKKDLPDTKVLILTMHDNYNFIMDALSAGINGYILKISDMSEIFEAIEQITNGQDYFDNEVTLNALKNMKRVAENKESPLEDYYLTKREKQVLKLIAEGHTYKKIAGMLYISHFTVINHRQNIIQKLELNNNAELIQFAIRNKLIDAGIEFARD